MLYPSSFVFVVVKLFVLGLLSSQLQAKSALKLIESVAEKAPQIQLVWPGFVTQFSHGIYHSDGDIYLLSEQQKLPGWAAKNQVNGLTIWYKKLNNTEQSQAAFFLGRTLEPGIVVDAVLNDSQPVRTLFHESFHEFQKQASLEKTVTDWSGVAVDTHMIKIKQAEFGLLKRLLNMSDQDKLKQQIMLYVSLRSYREHLMDTSNVNLERNMEWQEGVATYVGLRVNEIINQQEFLPTLVAYGERLNQIAKQQKLEKFMRFDAYFHGAAVSYLVSQFLPDWQQKINQGSNPFELLQQLFPAQPLTAAEVESSLRLGKRNQVVTGERFDPLQDWKKALVLNGQSLVAGFNGFQSLKVESKQNGYLAHSATKIHINNEYFELNGRAQKMFTGEEQAVFKLSSSPKLIKKCKQIDADNFVCQAGSKVKFGGIKIKLKQPMRFVKADKVWILTVEAV